jgi:hypothetical protein
MDRVALINYLIHQRNARRYLEISVNPSGYYAWLKSKPAARTMQNHQLTRQAAPVK